MRRFATIEAALLRVHRAKVVGVPIRRPDRTSTCLYRRWSNIGRACTSPCCSYRKLLKVTFGVGALRPHRSTARLDQGIDRPQDRASFGSGRFSSELVLTPLKDGSYRRHMDTVGARLSRTMGETAAQLKAIGITPWIEQQAGMFLWCNLPEGIDAADIVRSALMTNIVLAPGNAFSLSQTAGGFLRFNVAQSEDERIFKVLKSAMRDHEHLKVIDRERSG